MTGEIRSIDAYRVSSDLASMAPSEPKTLWLTGLPCSGKSTLASALDSALRGQGRPCVVLDGDALRQGLNRDLGFNRADRKENVRRVAEVARLFNDAGHMVVVALVSPYREDRAAARTVVGEDRYIEVYVRADLPTCEARDHKGHYARARAHELPEFTGIGSDYEAPIEPVAQIDTVLHDVAFCVQQVLQLLQLDVSKGR